MDVVVVGGGMGGLAAAVALSGAGHAVTVLERSPQPRESGAGIGVMPNGVRALERIGLGTAIRERALPGGGSAGALRDRSGRALLRLDQSRIEQAYAAPAVVLPRRGLAELLVAALPEGVLRTGAEVVDVDPGTGTVRIRPGTTGADDRGADPSGHDRRGSAPTGPGCGAPLHADLVVVADGAGSRLRRKLFPGHPGLRRSGERALQAITPGGAEIGAEIAGESLDRRTGERFGCLPIRGGDVYWYATWDARVPVPDDLFGWLAGRRRGWHPAVSALVTATPPDGAHLSETAGLARPLPSLVTGRVALLGDAAHAMPPDLGQGACQAFEDAATLGELASGDVAGILRRYDAARLRPTSRLQATAWRTRRLSTLTGIPGVVRDAALRLVPDRVAARAMAAQLGGAGVGRAPGSGRAGHGAGAATGHGR